MPKQAIGSFHGTIEEMAKSVKKALLNSFFQTFGAFGITGLNFVLMLGYARLLGPGRLGELTTAQAHVLVWGALVDLGLSNALIGALTAADGGKDALARQGFRARDIVLRVLFLRLLGALVGTAAIVGFAYSRARSAHDFDLESFRREIAFLPQLFALVLQHTAVSYATYRGRQGLGQGAMIFSTAVTVALPLWLASRGASVALLLFAQSWGGFLSTAVIALVLAFEPEQRVTRRDSKGFLKRGPWGMEAWRALARDAWPYALSYAAIVLWQRLDQIAASELLGFEQGGQYALSVRLAAIPILIAASIGHALFPDLQRVGIDAPEKVSVYMGAALKITFRYGFFVIGAIVLGVAVLVAPLVPKFKEGLQLLPWFLPGIWAYWLHSFLTSGLFGLRRYWQVIGSYAAALAVYVGALVPLTKGLGLVGVVLASNLFSLALYFASQRAAKRTGALARDFSPASPYSPAEAVLVRAVGERLRGLGARLSGARGPE